MTLSQAIFLVAYVIFLLGCVCWVGNTCWKLAKHKKRIMAELIRTANAEIHTEIHGEAADVADSFRETDN